MVAKYIFFFIFAMSITFKLIFCIIKIVSEYDQEILQSKTADNPKAP